MLDTKFTLCVHPLSSITTTSHSRRLRQQSDITRQILLPGDWKDTTKRPPPPQSASDLMLWDYYFFFTSCLSFRQCSLLHSFGFCVSVTVAQFPLSFYANCIHSICVCVCEPAMSIRDYLLLLQHVMLRLSRRASDEPISFYTPPTLCAHMALWPLS